MEKLSVLAINPRKTFSFYLIYRHSLVNFCVGRVYLRIHLDINQQMSPIWDRSMKKAIVSVTNGMCIRSISLILSQITNVLSFFRLFAPLTRIIQLLVKCQKRKYFTDARWSGSQVTKRMYRNPTLEPVLYTEIKKL